MTINCDSTCPAGAGFYTYDPSIGGNAVLLAIYVLLLPAVFYPDLRFYKHAFSVSLLAGLVLGAVGFAGRLLLHHAPGKEDLFALSLIGTTLGPTFFTGAVILTLPHTLGLCGDELANTRRRSVAAVLLFVLVAGTVILEVTGIVFVSYDVGEISRSGGAAFIAGGLGFQVLALLAFICMHFWFIVMVMITNRSVVETRYSDVCRKSQFRHFIFGTAAASLLLLAYSIYRIIEMAQGVRGQLFQNQYTFMVVNGVLPLAAAALVAIFQPARAFDTSRRHSHISPSSLRLRRVSLAHGSPRPGPRPRQMEERGRPWPYPYEPDIRKQLPLPSSTVSHNRRPSQQQPSTSATRAETAGTSISNNLPSNPKPIYKTARTYTPSPTRVRGLAERGSSRQSGRSEQAEMVEQDSLW